MTTKDECHEYGCVTVIEPVRRLPETKTTLGVGFDLGAWFVYDRKGGEEWHKHCGPYSTADQGREWINAIREGRTR